MRQAVVDALKTLDGLLVGFVVIFATIKIILSPESRAFRKAMMIYFVSVPVGILAALIAQEFNVQQATSIGIGCVCCLISEKLIFFILDFDFQQVLTKWIKDKMK